MTPNEEQTWAHAVRVVLGLVLPGLVLVVLFVLAMGSESADLGDETVLGWLLFFLGPFPLYYYFHRTLLFSLAMGAVLVTIAGCVLYGVATSPQPNSGVFLLWIPGVGYPLVGLSIFLEIVIKPDGDRPPQSTSY